MRYLAAVLVLGACNGNGDDDDAPIEGDRFEFTGAIHTVAISASSGSVSLTGKSGAVTVEFLPGEDGDNFQYDDIAGRLAVGSVCKDGSLGCGTSIRVTLPPGTDFEVVSESGPVSFVDMSVIGDVVTTTGRITGVGLGPMTLSTRSLTGDHHLEFSAVPTFVTMNGGQTGDLDLTVPCGPYQLDTTATGAVSTDGCIQDGPSGPDMLLSTGGDIDINGV